MRENAHHEVRDERVVRELIAENPWATIVSIAGGAPVASHYPVLIDEDSEDLALLTHVGRPDEEIHRFGASETLVIFAGPHGYISPSWYSERATPVPTWNFAVAHCHGTAEVLGERENLRVLSRLVGHFESRVERPVLLDPEVAASLVRGTVGLRVPVSRWVCKVKMSQDKDARSREQVIRALRSGGPYGDTALADAMQRAGGPITQGRLRGE